MQQILVYGDSLSWGIIPDTRRRLAFDARWPGVMEQALNESELSVRVVEDCLNGRRTVWDDPFKPGRNGLQGLAQRIESHSPLSLVILFLGVNDFQSMHMHNAWHSAQGLSALVQSIRTAPIEPGMALPDILLVAPPPLQVAKGTIAPKFANSESKAEGLATAIESVAREMNCYYFDAGQVTSTSRIDGVHLDADQHLLLGQALAKEVHRLISTQ